MVVIQFLYQILHSFGLSFLSKYKNCDIMFYSFGILCDQIFVLTIFGEQDKIDIV